MLILALDTTSELGGVGIYRDRECLATLANEGPANIYSVSLFQMVERLLAETSVRLVDIELFAAANGPGSFTGIRVGLAAAKAWATAFGRSARGVSVLEAMVEEARPQSDLVVPILDARRGEFFLSVFCEDPRNRASRFVAEGEALVLKSDALVAWLAQKVQTGASVTCLAREHDQVTMAWREGLPRAFNWVTVSGTLVGAIARLALRAEQEGKPQPLAALDACYIRRSDAELMWKD